MVDEAPIVYVIDDDEKVRQALEKLIRSVGLDSKTFCSAEEMLQADLPDRPSCLILDVRLHGMSGLELQSRLQSSWSIPIIFISGYANITMSVRAMKAGAHNFLEKPFEEQILLDNIHDAIERDAHRRRQRIEVEGIRKRLDSLTPREREVYVYIANGKPNKQIALALGVSEQTVKVHRAHVIEKMKAQSLADLVRFADLIGLIPREPKSY
jgi:RNA polymerase sigma factor (sigma-70 family)